MAITRYLVFANPPNDLYTDQATAEAVAQKLAKASVGTTYQVWRLQGDRVSTVTAEVATQVTPDS